MLAGPQGGLDGGEGRHDDADIVSQGGERLGQRAADVGQAAGLGEGGHFRAEEEDLERLHENLFAPNLGWHALRYSEGRGPARKHALRSTSGRATQTMTSGMPPFTYCCYERGGH